MMFQQDTQSSSNPDEGAVEAVAGRTEHQPRTTGRDATARPPGLVIPGESFLHTETPESGESYKLQSIAGHARVIAYPQPSPSSGSYAAITDYLNCTFPFNTSAGALGTFFTNLSNVAGKRFGIAKERGKGMNGYERSFELGDDGAKFCCVGQRGTALLMLPGNACHTIADWPALIEFLRDHCQARITRWDGAVDDYTGQHSVDDAVEQYKAGQFSTGGNRPSCNQIGNWIEPDGSGRTFYIGKRKNGKTLRVYEKGMQMGRPFDPWVRWELELHNVDRVVPWDVLLHPGKYVAGAYPLALGWIQEEMSRVATVQKEAQMSYAHLVECASMAYGPLVNVMMAVEESPEKVLEKLRRDRIPKRLQLPVIPAGVK